MVVAASCYGYACHWQGLDSFLGHKEMNRATCKHRKNPTGKPGSVYFPTDTERHIHISARQ
jgi:hypothetical protein